MNLRVAVAVSCLAVFLGGDSFAGLKSGPDVGSTAITPFHPTHVNGPDAGKKACLV
jgi:hypothetical protein